MKTWIDFDGAPVFSIPAAAGLPACEGMLIEGPQGWGEFSPPPDCPDERAVRWLTAAIEVGTVGWPDPVRGRVAIAVTVPAVGAELARQLVLGSGCGTAAVAVGGVEGALADDVARLEAVRDALGPDGAIRCDAAGAWDPDTAATVVPVLDRAAGGLEFVVDPCQTAAQNAAARARLNVQIALGRAIRDAPDARALDVADAGDVAVLGAAPLGGVRRALRVAEICGLPCVVAAEPRSSVAMAGELALAGVLPDAGFAHELGGVARLGGDVVSQARSLIPDGGWLPVAPMPPGPDPQRLASFAPDPSRVAWWRARLDSVQRYL